MLEIFTKRYDSLLQQLNKMSDAKEHGLKQIEKAIEMIEAAINELKQYTHENTFSSVQEEIEYFKNTLPYFQSQFIYYACLFNVERLRLVGGQDMMVKHLRKLQNKIHIFFKEHREFITYYKLEKSYQDILLFTKQYDIEQRWQFLDIYVYGIEKLYYTRYSLLLATTMAYERLQNYLREAFRPDKKDNCSQINLPEEGMTWQLSISALAELIIGLYASRVFKDPKITLAKASRYICRIFGVEQINIHKVKEELRLRKKSRTPFFDITRLNLLRFFDEEDMHAM